MEGRLTTYGWDDEWAALVAGRAEPSQILGRVVRAGRDRVLVATADGDWWAQGPALPVVGDWVVLDPVPDGDPPYLVAEVLPRRAELLRHRSRGVTAPQALAANHDVVLIATGLDRDPNPARLDRELVTAWQSGAEPLVVLTKADLVDAGELDVVVERLRFRLGRHHEVLVTSAVDGRGLEVVHERLRPHRTAALFGASGAGKSTLANRLLGSEQLATAAVRSGDAKGRHTTTARQLVPVATGGLLLDTPGLRSVGLWEVDDGLFQAFRDIEELGTGCRFTSCSHRDEPGCAVRAAIDGGTLDAERVESWRKLNEEFDALVHPAAQRARRRRTR